MIAVNKAGLIEVIVDLKKALNYVGGSVDGIWEFLNDDEREQFGDIERLIDKSISILKKTADGSSEVTISQIISSIDET